MNYASINPATGELLQLFPATTEVNLKLSATTLQKWRYLSVTERGNELSKVATLMANRKEHLAKLITYEMGKPYREALYEIEKAATAFEYYIQNAPNQLQPQIVPTQATQSFVTFEPLGIIFSIMPWNFPFWQVLRFAIPALIGGNVVIVKHSPNVPQCALALQQLFTDAGVMQGVYTNYFLTNEDAAALIASNEVRAISFTGSDSTGARIASMAGTAVKKCVMELGGNDPFIVFADADIERTVAGALKSRSINSGQSCNAAKRFIVQEGIAEKFTTALHHAVASLKVGDPMLPDTDIGPLARPDLQQKVLQQIQRTIDGGAEAKYGAPSPTNGYYVSPVVLKGVKPGMCAFEEEIFGPVWSITTFSDIEEAIELANKTQFGLGASIWTSNLALALKIAPKIEAGNVFINEIVKSDARLPFGGVKRSGFGRELSAFGLLEFQNIKTVFVGK